MGRNSINKGVLMWAACAACLAIVQAARADLITLNPIKDVMIFGTSAGVDTGNASGNGPGMFAGADGSGNVKRSLIQFDLSGIPAGATITGVTLTLYLGQVAGSGGGSGGGSFPTRIFGLYDILQNWGEGSSGQPTPPGLGGQGQGYAARNGDSTWDYAFFNTDPALAVKWNAGAGDLHGGNFSATQSAQSTFTSFAPLNGPYSWSSSGMVADVQGWLNGTTPNFGWLLKSENLESSATSFLGFWTKEGAAANNNPTLTPSLAVTYTVGAVPEPGGLVLLALGSSWLLARRRSLR